MNIGYIRVSSTDQNIDRQAEVMKELNIEERFLFIDKASGKDFNRPRYQAMKEVLREGDTLFIKSLDSFGRNKQEILNEWQWLINNKIQIIVLDMPLLDTRKYQNLEGIEQLITDLVLKILSWLAEEERKNIKQRQAEGIEVAKAQGKHLGRPKMNIENLTREQRQTLEKLYPSWKNGEITAVQLMKMLNLKKTTFYKLIKEHGDA